jgi:hypothetical protein
MNISEKTKVPLFAVICTVPALVGGIFWLTAIYDQGAEAARVNVRQDTEITKQSDILTEIRNDISEIKEHLRNIDRSMNPSR